MMLLYIENGNKLGTMIGMLFGVKKSKLIGFLKSIESYRIWESIISEDGMSCAEKICWIKIWRNSKEGWINKITSKSQMNMISYHPLFNSPANTLFSMRNSKNHNSIIKLFGSWNQYLRLYLRPPNAKEKAYSFSIKLEIYLDGKLLISKILQNHMYAKDIYSILFYLEVVNLIWEFMLYV
jgi:hypothetical protein